MVKRTTLLAAVLAALIVAMGGVASAHTPPLRRTQERELRREPLMQATARRSQGARKVRAPETARGDVRHESPAQSMNGLPNEQGRLTH